MKVKNVRDTGRNEENGSARGAERETDNCALNALNSF